jgi:hypothetical protein
MTTVPAEDPARGDEPAPGPDKARRRPKATTVIAIVTAVGSIITPIAVAIIEKL